MRKSIVIGSDRDLRNWLFEAGEAPAGAAGAAGAKPGAAPAAGGAAAEKAKTSDINSITGQTNIADVDPKAIVAAMQNPEANPKILEIINAGQDNQVTAEQIKAFVARLGPEVLIKRIGEVGTKLPATGLPKAEMPFLPASDIKDWKDAAAITKMMDAVSPGGKYQVDWLPPHFEGNKGGKEGSEQNAGTVKEAALRYLRSYYLTEAPEDAGLNTLNADPVKAEEWLEAGLKDGKEGEDEPAVTYVDQAPLTINSMIPTQKNVFIGKTLNMAVNNFPKPGVALGAYVVDAGKGIEILDGHHRWSAGYLLDPNMNLTGHLFNSSVPTERLLPILSRLGNALGEPTKLAESIIVRHRRRSEPSFDVTRWQRLAGIIK